MTKQRSSHLIYLVLISFLSVVSFLTSYYIFFSIPKESVEVQSNPSESNNHALLNIIESQDKKARLSYSDRIEEYNPSKSYLKRFAKPIPKKFQDVYNNPPPECYKFCVNQSYDINTLPSVSIIIPSRNESWGNLWRSLESLFKRTPEKLLKEIILFDDFNKDETDAATPIETLLASAKHYFPSEKLRIFRTKKREGLIRLKNLGVRISSGDVLVFLESHVEVQKRWLEPLLHRIVESPNSIVLPQHDLINEKTHKASLLGLVSIGAFNCKLTFGWQKPYSKENPYVYDTPVMPGGLFAMSRELWNMLGEYDDQSEVWGGENIELSIRSWSCGARMEFVTCSHVAHEFHARFQYKIPMSVTENTHRVAAVWTSAAFRKACNAFPEDFLFTQDRLSTVAERISLKKKLKCKDMDWYLENVYKNYPYKEKRLSEKDRTHYYRWAKDYVKFLEKKQKGK